MSLILTIFEFIPANPKSLGIMNYNNQNRLDLATQNSKQRGAIGLAYGLVKGISLHGDIAKRGWAIWPHPTRTF